MDLIEKNIREQIARDIEALGVRRHTDRVSGVTSIQYAARIARQEQP